MNIKRKVNNRYTPAAHPGFLGQGHTARPVIQTAYADSDPFIILMDDMLDKKDDAPAGGPHPHAGFETVTLLLEGTLGEEPHAMTAGDFEMMTAGKGVIHTEVITKKEKFRLLQLWLNLPKHERHAAPRVQKLKSTAVPRKVEDGSTIAVYSGTFAGVTSPIQNYTPVIIADIKMKAGASIREVLPADYNAFVYVLGGSVKIGQEEEQLFTDDVAWLDRYDVSADSELMIEAGITDVHLVLYAGLPQRHEIVTHGPFVADSVEEIKQLYADFRQGKMEHISDIAAQQEVA